MGRTKASGVSVPEGSTSSIEIDFYYSGVRCRERLKLAPTPANLAFARRKRDAVLHEIAVGTFIYSAHFPNSRRASLFGKAHRMLPTISKALDTYLQACRKSCALSTWQDYQSAIEHHLKPEFGDRRLDELTSTEIKAWIASLDISNKRINNILIPLRGMYSDAYGDEVIDRNPMDRVKNLDVVHEEPDPFTPDEITAILGALTGQARNFFQFAFWSGLRTGELIALEWQDVDWVQATVHVRRSLTRKEIKEPKTKSGIRDVKLLTLAREAIEDQRKHTQLIGGRVFHNPRTSKPWQDDQQIRATAWSHALRRAEVRYRYPYQTRHTYASMLLSAGEDPMWVARQMGHSDWGMIRKVYARWIPELNPSAGMKIDALLAAFTKSKAS